MMIVVGTLPLFLVLPINDKVEELYYITPFIGVALLLTGCMPVSYTHLGKGQAQQERGALGPLARHHRGYA